jgi:hypothetical protein
MRASGIRMNKHQVIQSATPNHSGAASSSGLHANPWLLEELEALPPHPLLQCSRVHHNGEQQRDQAGEVFLDLFVTPDVGRGACPVRL